MSVKSLYADRLLRRILIVLFCIIQPAFVTAGYFQDSTFSLSNGLNHCDTMGTLSLKIKSRDTMVMVYDSINASPSTVLQNPDVIVMKNNNFRFFWTDSQTTTLSSLKSVDVVISDTNAVSDGATTNLFDGLQRPKYFHADAGDSYFFMSGITNAKDFKGNFGNKNNKNINTIWGDIWANKPGSVFEASQSRYSGNDFLVVFERSHSIYFNKISINNQNSFDISQEITAGLSTNYMNPSIAADSDGNTLVLWGTNTIPQKIHCACFSGVQQASFVADTMLCAVDNADIWNRYDFVPVVSYGRNKFAAAYRDGQKIIMLLINTIASPLDITLITVTSGVDCRFPALANNNRSIALLWTEKSPSNHIRLKGVRYSIDSLTNNPPPEKTIADVEISATGNLYDTATVLNCAMDSLGNIGLGYEIDHSVYIATISPRNLHFDDGFYESRFFLFQPGLTDSVRFESGTTIATQFPLSAVIKDSIRVCVDTANPGTFFPLNDGASLKSNTAGLYKYFQYKTALKPSTHLFATPIIKKMSLKWDTKPRFDSLVSIAIGSSSPNILKFGDTIFCRSRGDSITCTLGMFDADSSDTLYPEMQYLSSFRKDTLRGFSHRSSSFGISPISKSDMVIPCKFSAHDGSEWSADDRFVYVKTRNVPPSIRVRAVKNVDARDTLTMTALSTINVQQNDSVEFFYSLSDSNDPGIKCYLFLNRTLLDSTGQNSVKRFLFHCSQGIPGGDNFIFKADDADDTTTVAVLCGVNHFPKINVLSVNDAQVNNGDTVRVEPGLPTPITIHAFDPDVKYWDTLTFIIRQGTREAPQKDSVFSYNPSRFDTAVTAIAHDKFGIRDSLRFFIKFPWYATDSVENPALDFARKKLPEMHQIIGSATPETVMVSIKNTGNDSLTIRSVRFTQKDRRWSNMFIQKGGALTPYPPSDSSAVFPLLCPPESSVVFPLLFTADGLKGDGLLYDTVIVSLNGCQKAADTLPIRFEYNDLPRIIDCKINFVKDNPYWLSKKTKKNGSPAQKFTFPPYAKISFFFSEPMDSLSALGSIRAYSVFDSITNKGIIYIPLTETWADGKTRADLSPLYSRSSPYFNIKPMPGFFIPTDSIRLVVSSSLTDTAKTPHGPNWLDVHRIAKKDTSDTAFSLRVDSVHFTITSVSPANAAAGVVPSTQVILTFSSAPLPKTMDMRLTDNRMLMIRSTYHAASTIDFSRISVSGDSIIFTLRKEFFYGDTVRCRYRSSWVRDSSGYSIDVNGDGIPAAMFAPDSAQDDKQWFFVIKGIRHRGVFPVDGEKNALPTAPLSISFSDTIVTSDIDTSPHSNRTLEVVSRYNRNAPIDFDSVRVLGTTAIFYPAHALFYEDNVTGYYRGLSTVDTARYAFDNNQGRPLLVSDSVQWSFSIRPIRLESVTPETSSTSSSMHPEITLRFSEPVFNGTFDIDTSGGNRSFKLTSSYSGDSALSYKSIAFSPDRGRVIIRPNRTFFSNDSIHCVFNGFSGNFTYNASDNLPGTGQSIDRSEWYFFIRTEEFYTFPNPYKPGTDPRHCSAHGPCGIWFKNLHVLKSGISEVSIKIFSIYAHPLYSTQSAGVKIRFQAGNPQLRPEWKWDTRNQHGELVASGLYLYAIYDPNGNVIMKGKLMIVR